MIEDCMVTDRRVTDALLAMFTRHLQIAGR